jgi:phage tail-like protein
MRTLVSVFVALVATAVVTTSIAVAARGITEGPTAPPAIASAVIEFADTSVTLQSVQGIAVHTDTVEFQDGSGGRPSVLPDKTSYGRITVTQISTGNQSLVQWYFGEIVNGVARRRHASIIFYAKDATVIHRYNLANAFPCAYEGPSFDGSAASLGLEKIEICAEAFEKAP